MADASVTLLRRHIDKLTAKVETITAEVPPESTEIGEP